MGPKPRMSGGTGKKIKKNNIGFNSNGGNPMANSSNLSMVLVMNNNGGARKKATALQVKNMQKRGNSSNHPPSNARAANANHRMNEFYF